MRTRWLAVATIGVAGCHSAPAPAPRPEPAPAAAVVGPRPAVRPQPPAVQPVAAAEPADDPDRDPLVLAARCLDRGDQAAAAAHLEDHVRRHPSQVMFRSHLAELHFRGGRPADAKAHFERFVADAQPLTGPPKKHLVHCHTRLMEIARDADDRAGELLHRGIGLVLLADDPSAAGEEADAGFQEEMLCKAVRTLEAARELRPADPRASLYLADAFDRMGNRRAADAARKAARAAAAPGALTPEEQTRLALRE